MSKKYKLDSDTAEKIALDVIRQHMKWVREDVKKLQENILMLKDYEKQNLATSEADYVAMQRVYEYFGGD